MTDFRAFQPVLGRIFDVESEFEVKFVGFKRPETKIEENQNFEKILLDPSNPLLTPFKGPNKPVSSSGLGLECVRR